jgi:hypothetical protein
MLAARNGDLATIKRLHAEGVDMTMRRTHTSGLTAVMVAVAARNGHTTVVKFLQATGASITEKNNGGFLPCILPHFMEDCHYCNTSFKGLQRASMKLPDPVARDGTCSGFKLRTLWRWIPCGRSWLCSMTPRPLSWPSCRQRTPSSLHGADTSVRSCRHTWSSSELRSSSTVPCLVCCCKFLPSTPRLLRRTCGSMDCASKRPGPSFRLVLMSDKMVSDK